MVIYFPFLCDAWVEKEYGDELNCPGIRLLCVQDSFLPSGARNRNLQAEHFNIGHPCRAGSSHHRPVWGYGVVGCLDVLPTWCRFCSILLARHENPLQSGAEKRTLGGAYFTRVLDGNVRVWSWDSQKAIWGR